jgi:hypothetical protein
VCTSTPSTTVTRVVPRTSHWRASSIRAAYAYDHPPVNERGTAGEVVSLEFARTDATGGVVRLLQWPDRAWFWAVLVSPAWGLVVVRDHDVAPPRRPGAAIRADGLWCELVEETPGEHATVALEAFGVRLDDPLDAEHGEWGERLAVGLDLEWEIADPPLGTVHGDVLLGAAREEFSGPGRFERRAIGASPRRPGPRLWWQGPGGDAHVAADGDVTVERDERDLPARVRVGDVELAVAALAVIPVDGRLVLALVSGPAGCGWLEWSPDVAT